MDQIIVQQNDSAMTYFFVLAFLFSFLAFYSLLMWFYVRGLRGILLAVQCLSVAVIASCLGIIQAQAPLLPVETLVMISRIAYLPLLMASIVQVDLYLADHNNHRSLTARTYFWYCRMTGRTCT